MKNKNDVEMVEWVHFSKIDFRDKNIKQYHIDTRDFHCMVTDEQLDKKFDDEMFKRNPEKFFFTDDEIIEMLNRYFNETGGDGNWRYFGLINESKNQTIEKVLENWGLKYIRIYRVEQGLVICSRENFAIKKEVFYLKINQKTLNFDK